MEILLKIFGEGKDLNALQMSCRVIVIFFIALLLIRISGRRSFGIRTPLDNIIVISLGAILSRAVVGASEFIPVVVCSFVLVILHRIFAWIILKNKAAARFFEGDKILLYENHKFITQNLKKALVSEEHILQGIRTSGLTTDMNKIDRVYIEPNGELSIIKK